MKKPHRSLLIILLLALAAAGGGTVIVAKLSHAGSGTTARSATDTASNRSKRPAPASGDEARLARIEAVRMAGPSTSFSARNSLREIDSLTRGLSLASVEALLADPALLADEKTGHPQGDFRYLAYPLRSALKRALWERYGELDPAAALARAFPDGVPTRDPEIPLEHVLYGVARIDPQLALDTWRTHYDPSPRPGDPGWGESLAIHDIMTEWTKQSPGAAAAALEGLGVVNRAFAYCGYSSALGPGSDWAAEVARFDRLFPPPADHGPRGVRPGYHLAASWAKSDPAAAFAWLDTTFSPGTDTGQSDDYRRLIGTWMTEQPAAAARFLKDRPPPLWADNDELYAGVLTQSGSHVPGITTGLLELIQNSSILETSVQALLDAPYIEPQVLVLLQDSPRLSPALRARAAAALKKRGME